MPTATPLTLKPKGNTTDVGQTAKAQKKKEHGTNKPEWDDESFLAELESRVGSEAKQIAVRLMKWARESSEIDDIRYVGVQVGKFTPSTRLDAHRSFIPFRIGTNGKLIVPFRIHRQRPPFNVPEQLAEWIDRLNGIPACSFSKDLVKSGGPMLDINWIVEQQAFEQFIQIAEWAISKAPDSMKA